MVDILIDYPEYESLAEHYTLVPVTAKLLADSVTPVSLYAALRTTSSFLLESVERGEHWGRYSFIGRETLLSVKAKAGEVRIEGNVPDDVTTACQPYIAGRNPFGVLSAITKTITYPEHDTLPPLSAGLVGYIGWDANSYIEDLPHTAVEDVPLDDIRLVLPKQIICFDHLKQELTIVINTLPGQGHPMDTYNEALEQLDDLITQIAQPIAIVPISPPQKTTLAPDDPRVTSNVTRERWDEIVAQSIDHIRAGDVFQVVPSQRFQTETTADPLTVFRILRVTNPSPYMYIFNYDDLDIVGSSPEALVQLRDNTAQIWPIAGSQPRGASPVEDKEREAFLLQDEKERAEHVMLIDLARNDLGKIATTGSVEVVESFNVVRYSHIMHLVSKVQAAVTTQHDAVDVITATFPAGTLSGAPKVRALEIIDDLEPTRRGVYGGGIGYIDLQQNVDLCIAIRTVIIRDGIAYVQSGCGIVADSHADREFEETRNKAMAVLSAVVMAESWQED